MLSLISVLLVTPVELPPCKAASCVCLQPADPLLALRSSAAVFAAQVLAVKGTAGDTGGDSPDGVPYFQDSVTFVVEQDWKGSPPDTVHAAIDFSGPTCPVRFTPKERYLVYAGLREGTYVIGVCTRTAQLQKAQGDIRALGQPQRTRP
jgi:hypothetical protein